jgi:transcriptional regulator GlxA family with amidase domain
MALHLVEQDYGPELAASVAREMVIYIRRNGESTQRSVYLEHRAHMHPAVHRVQDFIAAHPDRQATLEELADVAALSPRHLTRVFRETTGVTLKTFAHKVKLEVARNLLDNPELTIEEIAGRCGFQDARQLRRLWRQQFDSTLSEARTEAYRRAF